MKSEIMKWNFIPIATMVAVSLFLIACGPAKTSNELKEAWSNSNHPQILSGNNIVFRLSELPLEGTASRKGWSDNYWPSNRGGIAFRWIPRQIIYTPPSQGQLRNIDLRSLSPAEKYDIFMGRFDFPTVKSELSRTNVLRIIQGSPVYDRNYKIPGWFGLCHGWAPASLNFDEPKPVTLVGATGDLIPFGSSDIKALLSYYQQYPGNRSVRTYFMSERCNESFAELDKMLGNGEITEEEYHKRREQGACKGVNAGSFHLILANELGIKKEAFVADVMRDAEVWNQPVHHFRSQILAEREGASEQAAPGTVREVRVKTTIEYSVSAMPSWTQIPTAVRQRTYEYILELDAAGAIIGGEWLSFDRPDFLWRESRPEFRGYFKALEYIYEQSMR